MPIDSPCPLPSVVIPVFNESDNVEPLAREITQQLATLDAGFEIIFVDDRSTDATLETLQRLSSAHVRVLLFGSFSCSSSSPAPTGCD